MSVSACFLPQRLIQEKILELFAEAYGMQGKTEDAPYRFQHLKEYFY